MDIIEAKQKAKEKFMNDKTDYWEEELNATRIHPKHSQYFRPNMDIKRETSLEIQRLINEEEERKRKLDPNDPEYLDNLLKELSALRQKQQELAETKQKYQDKRDKKNTKFKGKWRTKKQQKNYELIKFVDQANMDYIEARDSKII